MAAEAHRSTWIGVEEIEDRIDVVLADVEEPAVRRKRWRFPVDRATGARRDDRSADSGILLDVSSRTSLFIESFHPVRGRAILLRQQVLAGRAVEHEKVA